MSKKKVILFMSVIFAVMLSMTAVFSSAYLTDMDKKDSIILKSAKLKNEITVELLQNHIDNGANTAVMTCTLKNQSNIDITDSIKLEAEFQMSNDGSKYNDKITALYVYPGELSDSSIISDINNGAANAYSRVVSGEKVKITLPDVVIGKDSEKNLSFKLAMDTDDLCGYGNILNIDIAAAAKTKNSGGGVGFTENMGTKSLTLYDNINTSDTNNTIVNGIQTIREISISGTYGVTSTEAAPLANLYEVLPIREKNKVSIADDNTNFSGYGLTIKNGKLYGTPSKTADVSFTDAVTFCYSGDTKKIGYAYLNLVIEPYDISSGNVEVAAVESFVYTGSAITPSPTVKNKNINKNLVLNEDYTLSYSDNVNVGTGTIKISGKGNYKGQVSKTFDISARDIAETTISEINDYTYTGNVIQPTPTITYNGKTLVKDTDYMLAYSNNTNAGTATITITGKDNYKGSINKTFDIEKVSILDDVQYIGNTSEAYSYYNGKAKEPKPRLRYNGKMLVYNQDYTLSYENNINAVTVSVDSDDGAIMHIKGIGNFYGELDSYFSIQRTPIGQIAVVEDILDYAYTGDYICPGPKLTCDGSVVFNGVEYTALDGVELAKGTDYKIEYSSNLDVGTATVTIIGINNFSSSISKTFEISERNIGEATIGIISAYTYDGKAKTPTPTVTYNGKTLVQGTDYALTYSNNTNAGTATVTILGHGNFGRSTSKTFTINKASQDNPTSLIVTPTSLTSVECSTSGGGGHGYYEYSKDGGKTWQSSSIFTGLTTDMIYSFAVRWSGDTNYKASDKFNARMAASYYSWNYWGTDTSINGLSSLGSDLTDINIPDRATEIDWYSFKNNKKITRISNLGENVTTIGLQAFYGCENISGDLTIPGNVISVGNIAFQDCYKLDNVIINNGVQSLGSAAFGYCENLKSVQIPSSITTLSDNVFKGCNNLTTINIYKEKDSISGAPWGATNATVNWLGSVGTMSVDEIDAEVQMSLTLEEIRTMPSLPDVNMLSPTVEPSTAPSFNPTATPEPSSTPSFNPTATPEPSKTPSPEPTSTPEPSSNLLIEPTLTPAPSNTPTPTILSTLEPTLTPVPSNTPTVTILPMLEPALTPVPSNTPTPTILPTLGYTLTPAPNGMPILTASIKMDKEKKTQVWVLSISVKNTVLDRISKKI